MVFGKRAPAYGTAHSYQRLGGTHCFQLRHKRLRSPTPRTTFILTFMTVNMPTLLKTTNSIVRGSLSPPLPPPNSLPLREPEKIVTTFKTDRQWPPTLNHINLVTS